MPADLPRGEPAHSEGMSRIRTALVCAAALIAAALPAAGAGAVSGRQPPPASCATSPAPAGGQARQFRDIARRAQQDLGLNAVVLRVTRDGKEVVTAALGQSMTGVPATADMHLRSGSVAIAYMGDVLLQLVDEHEVGLDDPVSRWLPDLPHGGEITLRMLAASTSGLHDYVTDPKFVAALEAAPFRQWTAKELLAHSLAHPLWYAPGTNWSYSHANFVLLGAALEKITGICDMSRSAVAVGSGELLSPGSYQVSLDPGTVGLGKPTAQCPATVCLAMTPAHHFGIGLIVQNGWILQNPSFSGYAAIQAHLPSERLAIAVSTTLGPDGAEGNTAQTIAYRIADALSPGHPLEK